MSVSSDLSSAFIQIPVTPDSFNQSISTNPTTPSLHPNSLNNTVASISFDLAPPPYSPVDSPPAYFCTDHWLLVEVFHSLFFFPASHPFLTQSIFTTSPLSFDSTLFCSIAFPPHYEPQTLTTPQPSSANTAPSQPHPIVRHREHERARRFARDDP